MKIQNNLNGIYLNTFKGTDKPLPEPSNSDNEVPKEIVYISPEFYKNYADILSFKVEKNEQGLEYIKVKNLIINPIIVNSFLRNEEGDIDRGATLAFIRIYNGLLSEKTSDSKTNIIDYENEKQNIRLKKVLEDKFPDKIDKIKDENILNGKKDVLSGMEGVDIKAKLELLETMQACERENLKNNPEYAIEETIKIFLLSRTNDGYDFSDLQGKKDL